MKPSSPRPAPDSSAGEVAPGVVADVEGDESAADSRSGRPAPYLALAAAVALLVPLRAAVGTIRDIDVYWHLLVGQDILAGTGVPGAGHGWSFGPVADTWVSTQWLAEVAFAKLEQWGGLQALLVYRTVTMVAAVAVLACVTIVRRPPRASVWMFAIGALTLSITVQERSQQVTFLLAPLVGWWMERLWRQGRLPRWWVVLPLVVVWANIHGGWVILPLGIALAAVARLLDHGWHDLAPVKALALSVGCLAASCVSPSGLDNLTASRRFASSTALLIEWQPVTLWDWTSLPLLLIGPLIFVAWAKGRVRPSRGEIVLVLALLLFATVAWRNVTPAVLVLAPIATGVLARALGEPDPWTGPLPWARTALVAGVVGTVLGLVVAFHQTPVIGDDVPQKLLATLASATADQKVLNTYNVSGPLLWLGGRPPHVRVAVDGRADRYGGDYIAHYLDAIAGKEGWQKEVDMLAPTAALLRTDEALAGILVAQRHWVEVERQGVYVLLRAPDAKGWPTT